MKYYDKNGNEILVGMHIRHNNGDVEEVFATMSQYGDDGLGISATNPAYAAKHDCELEYYSLSNFDLTEWEIVEGNKSISMET